jgi:hypothetical protein
VIKVAARRAAAIFHSPAMLIPVNRRTTNGAVRRNRFGLKLVNFGNYHNADKIRERAPEGAAIVERVGSSWASRRRMTT